jgi:hypothetical protein
MTRYVFLPNSENEELVNPTTYPLDPFMSKFLSLAKGSKNYKQQRINVFQDLAVQWSLGGPGSGAPVHFHNAAWNQVGKYSWIMAAADDYSDLFSLYLASVPYFFKMGMATCFLHTIGYFVVMTFVLTFDPLPFSF